MIIEIKIPSPGESITEVELASWFVENGDTVTKDQEVGEVESEKATLPLIAESDGKIEILVNAGETVAVGTVVCRIDTSVKVEKASASKAAEKIPVEEKTEPVTKTVEEKTVSEAAPAVKDPDSKVKVTPVARKMMAEAGLNVDDIISGLRKISSDDVNMVLNAGNTPSVNLSSKTISREVTSTPMTQLRKKLSQRLVAVKNETAMLTTFNEADMSAIMSIRKKYQDKFVSTHDVKLGFMSFFTKACALALQKFPNVNSFIDGENIVSPGYCDIGIAVQTDKGLMVPVIRNTETLGLADIEKNILELAGKARKNRISMDELTGGTFTITNGGIFGSMLSTPILNPPQSAILGMHNIIERPVAVNGKVEIRPMMYLALSYDHRIIDGRDSVGFLKTVKEFIEAPFSMIYGSSDAGSLLLEI